MSRADDFTQARFAWLDRIAADPEIGAFAFRVAYVLSSFFNRSSGEAWPAQGTIADRLSATRRGVQKAIDDLERQGHVTVRIMHGRGHTNVVRMAVAEPAEKANDGSPIEAEKANDGSQQGPIKGEQPFAFKDEKRRTAVRILGSEKVNSHSVKGEQPFTQNSLKELSEGYISQEPSDLPSATSLNQDFERWYAAYPRKVAKGAAAKAYRTALTKASPDALAAGAERYASERRGQDPKFTKHPASWLNGECWADEATAPDQGDVMSAFDRLDAKIRDAHRGKDEPQTRNLLTRVH